MTLKRTIATPPGQPAGEETIAGAEETAIRNDWSANELTTTRAGLRQAFIAEGVRRISAQVPEWDSYARVRLIASVWNMLGAPNAAQTKARDIYLYVRDTALPKIGTLTVADMQQVDPTAPAPFLLVDPTTPGWPT